MKEYTISTNPDDLFTMDEIHFTSGAIWSCVLERHTPDIEFIIFIKGSFAEAEEKGFSWRSDERIDAETVKDIILDALKGGAKIVKGVGWDYDWQNEEADFG